MLTQLLPSMDEEIGFRYVRCFCGASHVVTRRPPEFDKYAVCSKGCFISMQNKDPNVVYKITGEM